MKLGTPLVLLQSVWSYRASGYTVTRPTAEVISQRSVRSAWEWLLNNGLVNERADHVMPVYVTPRKS